MSNAIFLDDSADNLYGSNAPIKVCFGRLYPWNESWDGDRCYNWLDFKQYIEELEGYIDETGDARLLSEQDSLKIQKLGES